MTASNTLISVEEGTCYSNTCPVFVTGQLTSDFPNSHWDRAVTIEYRSNYGTWVFCGYANIPALVIGQPIHYGGETSPMFTPGHTYYFHTIARLLDDATGQVLMTAYSQDVAYTLPGS